MKLNKLRKKEVINIYNGNCLGQIKDIIFNLPTGNIESLIVKQSLYKRIINFFNKDTKIIINWENIVSIGNDVILVNIIQ